ncbi:hypothetical protein P691DRAFT_837007 [Macrolepiota fuliginosa MF-IS2]|uniref:Uncharacterized protein n=1 Tax=Macrolepiota fuliginosa MF-IS2 TaxID=1400762 RepID=A0A9P6C0D8_9AGAR|nr:hypothetical protein P691DRAFT_837007 [Macrolepiota fuliginosa MF-IS2]
MTGPAGVDKSAVAQTCAEKLKAEGQLGASYFFLIDGHIDFFGTYCDHNFQHQNCAPQSFCRPPSVDAEIKLYLEGGFENTIRRRNFSVLLPWPSETQLDVLVAAAAGIFVYAATVLRFIDHLPSLDPDEALHIVLAIISRNAQATSISSSKLVFAELDEFYTLIMQRIPVHVLPSVQLFLAVMFLGGNTFDWSAIFLSNVLRVTLYHKSFFDFLKDPTRSGSFCIPSQRMKEKLFVHLLQLHHDLSQTYRIQGSGYYLKRWVYDFATSKLVYSESVLDMSHSLLRRLVEVDYCKMMAVQLSLYDCPGIVQILHRWGIVKRVTDTFLYCIPPEEFRDFDLDSFYKMVDLYQELKIIKPCSPSYLPGPSSNGSRGRLKKGLHVFGRGRKRHFWGWEINTKQRCYFKFETANSDEARAFYQECTLELSDFGLDKPGYWDKYFRRSVVPS